MKFNLRSLLAVAIFTAMLLGVCGVAAADSPAWYSITFTGADIWAMSADNALQARTDQTAPRRYATYLPDGNGPRVLQATTYGVGGLPGTGFNAWALTSGFAFDEINLWGAGGADMWGETYVSVGNTDPSGPGVSSWKVIQSPTSWTSGIVEGGQSYSADDTHAFPVWRSGTGTPLGLSIDDPSFVFTFEVLISNPSTAIDANGNIRIFFGGFSDDNQNTGPDNHEVSGAMDLHADPVTEPGFLVLLGIGLGVVAVFAFRRS